jgi:ubiquinone/menaquinone biosynthesis C-methylase UbiE
MKASTKQRFPRWLRRTVRQGRYLFLDALDLQDKLLGRHDPLRPPRRMIAEVGGSYDELGNRLLEIMQGIGELKPTEHILEIGCGCGRITLPLARYLQSGGAYEGLDIVAPAVRWCQEHITPQYPAFRFVHSDIYNTSYNRAGRIKARDYVFPYPKNTFDFVFLHSVFTHMLPDGMKTYLKECARVMKVGARCLITFLLINEESLRLLQSGRSPFEFPNVYGNYRTAFRDNPEGILAYDESFVRQCYSECGLTIVEPIYYGAWAGRANPLHFQDTVLARLGVNR